MESKPEEIISTSEILQEINYDQYEIDKGVKMRMFNIEGLPVSQSKNKFLSKYYEILGIYYRNVYIYQALYRRVGQFESLTR